MTYVNELSRAIAVQQQYLKYCQEKTKKAKSLELIKAVHALRKNPARGAVEGYLRAERHQDKQWNVMDLTRVIGRFHYTLVLDALKNLQITGKVRRNPKGWVYIGETP